MTRLHRSDPITPMDQKLASLRKLLEDLIDRRHPYAKMMADVGVKPEHIKTEADLAHLPTTTKKDLLDAYPKGWFGRDDVELQRVQATSGTTGKACVCAYTRKDLKMWAENIAWCLDLAKVTKEDIIQVSYGYGLFTGGAGLHDGAHILGALVVPASGGFTDRQITLLNDLDVTVLACTPSYALRITEAAEAKGMIPKKLKIGIFGAEAWSDELHKNLEDRLGIRAHDIYGLTEGMGPGVCMECTEQKGLHVSDDFIAQVIDPKTLEVLPEGEDGELVMTAWNKEGYPTLRYRTRDLTHLIYEPCKCGDATPRIARLKGRTDDMLIMHGVNVFPSVVESALVKVKGLTPNYQITAWMEDGVQELAIAVERTPDSSRDQISHMTGSAAKKIKQMTGINIPIEVKEPGELPRSEGKAVRIIKK